MNTRTLLTLFALLLSPWSFAQSWESMTGHSGAGRHHPITVSNDQYGYVIAGQSGTGTDLDDVHRYEFATGTWTQLDNFPGGPRGFAYGVNEGNDAYLGFGSNAVGYPTDWWHLDMTTGTWTELASFPGEGRNHPALVWVNNQVVMALGGNADGNQGDTWVYDIATDTWTEGAAFTYGDRHHPFYFGIDGIAYIGMGHGNSVSGNLTIYNDWYAYNPAADTWTQLAFFPDEARVAGTQFAIGGKGYVLSGDGDNHGPLDYGEFWEYNPTTDTWTELTPHPGGARWAPGTFVSGCFVYLTGGLEGINDVYHNDLMRFSINTDCGCTDNTAFNYEADVLFEDGSCCYNAGCTDATALNYDPEACFDDGNCIAIVLGCTDPEADLYYPEANAQTATGGPLEETALGPGGYHYNDLWDMVFDVSEPTLLVSVDVLAQNSGTFSVDILDSNSEVIYQDNHTVASGWNTLELNVQLPAGTDFTIGVTGNGNNLGLYRNNAVPAGTFPIPVADRIDITGNTTVSAEALFYYFYAWVLEALCDPFVGVASLTGSPVQWYPNPAQGDLWLHGQTGRYTLAIRDLNGRLLLTEENQLNGKQHVDISALPAGVYTVGILTQGEWHRAPLVVR